MVKNLGFHSISSATRRHIKKMHQWHNNHISILTIKKFGSILKPKPGLQRAPGPASRRTGLSVVGRAAAGPAGHSHGGRVPPLGAGHGVTYRHSVTVERTQAGLSDDHHPSRRRTRDASARPVTPGTV